RDGVFYAQNPANVLRARAGLTGFINVPAGIDVTFSNAALTGPGGHPLGLFFRNLARGAMLPTDSNSTSGFVWTIADHADLDVKWPQILASHPDFIKTMLLYSEEYERRKSDTAFFNWRGLNPALLPEIVRRAHAVGLRVMTHIETAGDFHNALIAGADEIGHTPGFRGNEKTELPDFAPYLITDADADLAANRGVFGVTHCGITSRRCMRTSLTLVCALSLGLGPTPLLGQATSKSRQQTVRADTAELGYESAMKKDLRQLATAEEAYFVENTAYYSG